MLVWTAIIAGLGVLVLAFFPTIVKQAQTFQNLLAAMPKGLLSAFGLETISITDIVGFYATKQYPTVTLFGSIYAMMLGAGMLSKEENDKTMSFLLSKPVKRSAIVTQKLWSYITLIIIFNILVSLITYISLQAFKTVAYNRTVFFLLCIAPVLLHLTFAALGFLASVFINRSRSILPFALGLVLVTYFLGIAAALADKLNFLKYFSPFEYVDAVDIISHQKIEPLYLMLMLLINITAIALTYILYKRKNIMV
jgi:ABC-2 type transport system permease protein